MHTFSFDIPDLRSEIAQTGLRSLPCEPDKAANRFAQLIT
jgi:hypothetical protein